MAIRKIYRIEELSSYAKPQAIASTIHNENDDIAAKRHAEIMNMLKSLHASGGVAAIDSHEISEQFMSELRKNMAEAQKLKSELDVMLNAIEKTKADIAALHINAVDNGSVNRVSNELDAIVTDTESATNKILNAAEGIDNNAATLIASLKGDKQGIASDIQEQIIAVYEACNFQDLTGQRITKVIKLLRFIEERIHSMMDIWGGIETFKDVTPAYSEKAIGDAALLNGPSLSSDIDTVSQDDIDALFA